MTDTSQVAVKADNRAPPAPWAKPPPVKSLTKMSRSSRVKASGTSGYQPEGLWRFVPGMGEGNCDAASTPFLILRTKLACRINSYEG